MQTGIYEIVNTVNGKRYVGSSVNIPRRWAAHRHLLRHGKSNNHKLKAAWEKYGEQSFAFNVLELCSKEELIEKEQYHIDIKSDYNIRLEADSNFGREVSDEERMMRSKIMLKRYRDDPGLSRIVSDHFKSLWSDSDYRSMMSRSISESATKHWSDPERKAERLAKRDSKQYRDALSVASAGIRNPRYDKEIYDFVSPEGHHVKSTKLDLYTRYNLDKSHVTSLVKGRLKQHKGWTMKKAPEGA